MRLNREFLTHETGDETILVPTGKAEFSGVVRGNRTLGAVLQLLKEDRSRDEIVQAMKERFDAPDGAIERDVDRVLEELGKIGAIDE